MKKILAMTILAASAAATTANAAVLINELYPGGGSGAAGTAYTRDFVELYNTGATPVVLTGYSLQYAPATSTNNFSGTIVNFGVGSVIGANDYLTVYTGSAGTAGTALTAGTGPGFVTYSAPTSSASLQAASGAVRLLNAGGAVVDLIGYGTVATGPLGEAKSEGTAATALPAGNATSFNRTNFSDTNNNSADFTSATPSPNAGTLSTVVPALVPEPTTLAAIAGLGLIGGLRRRRA